MPNIDIVKLFITNNIMDIKVKKHRLIYKGYKIRCSIGKSGITKSKKEGDLATPKGKFGLGKLYFRKDRIKIIKCNLKKKAIRRNMGWCDDSRSKRYNKEIIFPNKWNAEKLYRKDAIYDLLINIKYNVQPTIKKKGSAIFLHLANKKFKPTMGCIAISKNNFLKILPLINKSTKIIIN
ncbi:MAG: L,D-peptidoglycan transpeptidase YkuD, ErfK/YbiS/YcfS/YnhG family [Pelagibacterales bacterium]|nr:L,D-peptidoglycan transpeptidase YkuD, ErfK/YbiS/YcfS/YnhG family [Pelagibacterales bacterium]